ncbi:MULTISPECIES: tetratricopeptide repeat protein [Methylobacterium]|uniref:tetratricopeptide repeat protein n=1 Tax=Methylobacterium TaxID=407 RepID=UPI0010459F61|nr:MULTISPECIES: tetratricopeptide repeat protein [Methylobacterium]MDR7037437.1 tetratricopeptide (TPR) repeat protein [Methylobacterium sp. BE186]
MLRLLPLALAALLAAAHPAAAAPPGTLSREPQAEDRDKPETAKPKPPASLDELFARLRDSEDDAEARGISKLIERRLDRSGSATADLLTERARQAMASQDFPLAVELMDRVLTLEPGWSEGWSRRASVFWHLSDKAAAIADLQRALVLEPRHFEAWATLGRLYLSMDDKARALGAFRRAAALYPRMDKVQSSIERLAPEVDGRDL